MGVELAVLSYEDCRLKTFENELFGRILEIVEVVSIRRVRKLGYGELINLLYSRSICMNME